MCFSRPVQPLDATTTLISDCMHAQVVSALHQRFPELFSVPLVSSLQSSLQAPSKAQLTALAAEQKDKEESARVLRQRGLLRIFAELELAGIVRSAGDASSKKGGPATGEATFGIFKDLVSRAL